MAYHGRFHPRNPQKYRGDVDNIIWRSTWECVYMNFLDKNDSVISWSSEEVVVPYRDPITGNMRRYFVDFWARMRTKDGSIQTYLIEIKPANQIAEPIKRKRITKKYITEVTTFAVNTAKWNAAREFCADRGWSFKILDENDLGLT
jgi:hypothetical protein